MLRNVAIVGALVLMALVAVPAEANHCSRYTTSVTDSTQVVVGGAGSYFVADTNSFRSYVYDEANGIAGLQRSDPGHDDTCHGQIASDARTL